MAEFDWNILFARIIVVEKKKKFLLRNLVLQLIIFSFRTSYVF